MEGSKIIITLEDYRKEHNISKYKIIKNCGVGSTQLNNYCNNNVSRIDLPVLARICDYLECDISDILEYVPEKESELEKEYDEEQEAELE
ncbi:MAG: helix-turn-helix transcriptional regulator [Ruminococcus sp.]|nr:helix-turn-helix transcriptional regulator [Ruminococcus sp.]